ncbi:hypothetical protein [Planctomycetes bacterium K23_9]|uniref:hypothetical protein n=1 Tax=Stieleria marina TaxID=1930275 RepID=UPI0011AA91A7
MVRFQLIEGRLQLDAPRHRKGSQSLDQNGIYESITVTASRGIPSVHYVCQTDKQQLTLSVAEATKLRIESYLPETGDRAVLEQPESGPVTWTVARGDLKDEYEGPTLLHIHQADPVGFRLHCGVIFKCLMQGRSLRQIEAETTAAMIRQVQNDDLIAVSRDEVLDCVERLGASRRSVRFAASKQLLRWGTPVIPIIDLIDANQLSCEQNDRMQSIRRRLKRVENDTPESLATMLVNDSRHWQSIARGLSDDQIRLANQHLGRIGLERLAIPNRRIEQIARDESGLR